MIARRGRPDAAGASGQRAGLSGARAGHGRRREPGRAAGRTVTLTNDATGVAVERVTDAEGRYLFDFVEPGTYTVTAELQGFKRREQQNVRVPQRGDVTVDLVLELGDGRRDGHRRRRAPSSVQFNSSSSRPDARAAADRPGADRRPQPLQPGRRSIRRSLVSPATSENRPYHHAYANDYDAGGGTRRANDVLLDGVPLGASFKTSYTPSMDAVEEITVSKNSVDAENGNSLGGIISLNMKSGTNTLRGSAYMLLPRSEHELDHRPDDRGRARAGHLRAARHQAADVRRHGRRPDQAATSIFSFTSFEEWNDKRPLSIVRTVPTELERRGDFSQSVLNGAVRTIYNPFTLDARRRRPRRAQPVSPATSSRRACSIRSR